MRKPLCVHARHRGRSLSSPAVSNKKTIVRSATLFSSFSVFATAKENEDLEFITKDDNEYRQMKIAPYEFPDDRAGEIGN